MAIRKVSQTPPTMASIVNTYSTSENDGYACDYLNGKTGIVIYTNTSGTSSNIVLDDDIANYSYIEVFTRNNDDANETYGSFKFDVSKTIYTMMGETVSANSFNIFTKTYTKGTTTAGKTTLIASNGKLYSGIVSTYEVFKVIKIIGYK